MLFEEWVEWNWNTSGPHYSNSPAFRETIKEDKQRALKAIKQQFQNKDPKVVVKISEETFMSLPGLKEDSIFPDFTSVIAWLQENMSDRWHHYDTMNFLFASEEDATAFKLRF